MIISIYKDCAVMQCFYHEDMINAIKNQHKLKRKYKVKRFYINNLNWEEFSVFNF
jgi:hypothetical protein